MTAPRVGHINFINCLPLTYSLNKDGADGLAIHAAVPSALNNDIVSGRLDVSPVSSIVYAQNHEKLKILPNVSIMADGIVQSIILVSRKPIDKLTDDKIMLTAKSATSHCLLKIVLNRAYGANPDYHISVTEMNKLVPDDATAALLIGDDALYVNHHHEPGWYYYDIGEEWKKLTGLCMVYAVWVVNRSFAAEQPELLQVVYDRIISGFRSGKANKALAIEMIIREKPFSYQQLDEYLEVIKWKLDDEQQAALLKFYELAHAMNLIDTVPSLDMAEVY